MTRCLKRPCVIDLDIENFFDTVDHSLMLKVVRHVDRWLIVPSRNNLGEMQVRNVGTPQGGVASPLLASLYFHYVFDR